MRERNLDEYESQDKENKAEYNSDVKKQTSDYELLNIFEPKDEDRDGDANSKSDGFQNIFEPFDENQDRNQDFISEFEPKDEYLIPIDYSKLNNSKHKYLEEIRKLAEERNIKLLSTKFINNTTNLEFQCNNCQRKWKDYRTNIKQKVKRNTFKCPHCEKKTKEALYKKFQDLAKERGGKLLSKEFYGMTKNHKWKCGKCGLEWEAKPSNVKDYPSKKGTWCPDCGYESMRNNLKKYTIEDMQKLAKSKPSGGECLSKKFIGVTKYHTWKCGTCGHVWKAKPTYIIGKPSRPEGAWCPNCAKGREERICRNFFESLFGVNFPSEHNLEWLKKYGLHLDGYNKDLGLAFERQGKQHYIYHKYFHKNNPKLFEKRKKLDEYKREKCRENGIILIEVGYEWRDGKLYKIKVEEMEDYIRKKCIEQDIIPPKTEKKIEWRHFDVSPPEYIYELQELANKRNGKLLSDKYFGETTPLHWFCNKHKYDWWANPNDIRGKPSNPNGSWCPKCARERHKKIMKEKIKERKRDKMGKFIS